MDIFVFHSVYIVSCTTNRKTRSTQPMTLPISNKSRWTRSTSVTYVTIYTLMSQLIYVPILNLLLLDTHGNFPFLSFLTLVVLQREILQQQRPADLHAYYTWAHALLPCQSDHQWGIVGKKRNMHLDTNRSKINWTKWFCVLSWNTKRIWCGWGVLAASCMTPLRWSTSETSPSSR